MLLVLSPLNVFGGYDTKIPDQQKYCYENQCHLLDAEYYFEFENMHTIKGLFTGQNYDSVPEVSTLNGCRNDAWNFYDWATLSKGVPFNSLEVLTDRYSPLTRVKLLSAIEKLAKKTHSEPGPHRIIMSFSGHGTHRADLSGDELDGRDELMVCGRDIVSDDELHDAFKGFHENTRILVFVDTCHSGTMFDLPYSYIYNSQNKDIIEEINTGRKREIPAYMMVISASRDIETASDAFLPNPKAITWSSQGDFSNRMINTFKEVFYNNLYVRNIPALLRDQKMDRNVNYNLNQNAVLSTNFRVDTDLKLFGW